MSMTSDEVNFLVYRYLQESGFSHSAFTFAYESQVGKTSVVSSAVPPGALISFLQKGLQYVSIEASVNEDGSSADSINDTAIMDVSLINPHTCKVAQNGATRKMKRKRDSTTSASTTTTTTSTTPREKKPIKEKQDPIQIPSEEITTLSGHTAEVFICAWSPVENVLASSSGDSTARIWKAAATINSSTSEAVAKIAASSSKPSYSFDKSIVLKHESVATDLEKKDVTTIEWNATGTMLASGSYDGQGRIWDKTGALKTTLSGHNGPLFSLKWNKSGKSVVSASYDKTAIVWDAESGNVVKKFSDIHSAPVLDVDWKDDATFATCSSDKSIKVCSTTCDDIWTLLDHTDEVNTVSYNPTGSVLASCSDDMTSKLWKDSACVGTFRGHSKEIYTMKWSKTGDNTAYPNAPLRLGSASFDTTVRLWDIETQKCLQTLMHENAVYSLAFSPNGDYVASGSLDGGFYIWCCKTGRLVKSHRGRGDIYSVDWNFAGDLVAASFSDNTLSVVNFRS